MSFSVNSIEMLHYPEVIRKRLSLYIHDTTSHGLHELAFELVRRIIEPKFANDCTSLVLTLHADNSLSALDNGREQPVYLWAPTQPRPAIEVLMTAIHFGGDEFNIFERCGNLFEFGSLINALSEWLVLETMPDGNKYHMACAKGTITQPLHIVGETTDRGTYLRFKPDTTIWSEPRFDTDLLAADLIQLTAAYPETTLALLDERTDASIKLGKGNL